MMNRYGHGTGDWGYGLTALIMILSKAEVSKRLRLISLVCPPAGRSSNDHTQAWLLEWTTIACPGSSRSTRIA